MRLPGARHPCATTVHRSRTQHPELRSDVCGHARALKHQTQDSMVAARCQHHWLLCASTHRIWRSVIDYGGPRLNPVGVNDTVNDTVNDSVKESTKLAPGPLDVVLELSSDGGSRLG